MSVRVGSRSRGGGGVRILIGLAIAAFALISFFTAKEYNPVTDEEQHISLTPDQEIALGLQAVPELLQQYGGEVPNAEAQAYIDEVGFRIVDQSVADTNTDWEYEFYLLNDAETINAFALPGGQIFITAALYQRLESEGQLAGVLGHEIGHVEARHGAERIAQQQLSQGLIGAVLVASDDARAAQLAAVVSQLVNMQYGRDDELQSDELGVLFMSQAGYNPESMIGVMQILAEAGGGGPPEFFSTHPNPENRIQRIQEAIDELYPNGVPDNLES